MSSEDNKAATEKPTEEDGAKRAVADDMDDDEDRVRMSQ